MAIARVGGSGAVSTVSNGSSLPISYTPAGVGNLLTVSLGILETATLSAPTVADSSSTAWTVKSFQKPADQFWAAHGYRENNPSGLTSVTSTFPGNTYARGQVSEWSGVATSSAYDTTAGNVTASAGAASSLASGSLTSSGSNSLILGVAGTDDSIGTGSWNTTLGSFTQLFAQAPNVDGGGGSAVYQIASGSAGPFSLTWSLDVSQNGWASLFIAFLPAAAASTGGAVFQAQGPGNTAMAGRRFRPFVQGVPAAAVVPQSPPGIPKDQQMHPGAGPGNRPFPNFRQGVPAAAVIPQSPPASVQVTAMHPGRGPGARQFPNFVQGFPATAATQVNVDATPGTWSWAGVTATTSQLIYSDGGPTAWTWAGTTATTSQLINASPGTWTWVGIDSTTTQLINASPGTWSWGGTTSTLDGAIAATPGTYTWAGTTATTTQLINASPGTWSWAGLTATTNQSIDAIVGAWSWSGTTSTVVQSVTVDASPATYTWAGTTATVVQTTDVVGSGGKGKKRKQANTGPSYADEFKDELARLREAEALRERIAQEDEEILALVAGFVSVITR